MVMMIAVIISTIIMAVTVRPVAGFVERHPTVKMLALSFLVMIGVVLLIEGWEAEKAHDLHLKNYVYFAMAFSVLVEMLNLRMNKNRKKPVKLRNVPEVDEEN